MREGIHSSKRIPPCFVRVTVSDRGPGIDPEDRARMFERFVRGKTSGETRVHGSGIGLSLVQHIAQSHGRTIKVKSPISEEVRGCAFELAIPVDQATLRTPPASAPAVSAPKAADSKVT